MSRNREAYELTCHGCKETVEFPCDAPHQCPRCGAVLTLNWRPSEPVHDTSQPDKSACEPLEVR